MMALAAVDVLGWSLLHSLWQGALVAVLLWAVLRIVRDGLPGVRYGAALVALATLLALPVVNYRQTVEVWEGQRSWVMSTADAVIRGQIAAGRADPEAVTEELRRRHASAWTGATGATAVLAEKGRAPARALAWLWLAGALVLAGRLALDYRRARRLAESGRADPAWREAARAVARRIGVERPVRVRVTDRVDVPGLVGWRWPVVLVPPGTPTDPGTMRAVLAHEIAHVRRHDALVNFLQAVAEVLLFYNPAAWWISARIREERECSCDVTAVDAVDGGLPRYLRTLLDLETARAPAGAVGFGDGSLVRRVRRLHDHGRGRRGIDWRAAAALLLAVAAIGWGTPRADAAPPLAARISATSLIAHDLDGMRLVVRTVRWAAPMTSLDACPEESAGREV